MFGVDDVEAEHKQLDLESPLPSRQQSMATSQPLYLFDCVTWQSS